MRKITFLMVVMAALWATNVFAQTWVEDVYLYEDYSSATGSWVDGTPTQGVISGGTLGDNTFSSAIHTINKNVEIKTNVKIGNFINNVKTFSGSGTPYTSPSGKLTISFICKIGSAQTYSGAYYYFRDDSNKPIFGLGFARINSGGNKWLAVRQTEYVEWTNGATDYPNISQIAHLLPTAVDAPALKITAILDFINKTYSLKATSGTYTPNGTPEWVDSSPLNEYNGSNIPFLDANASNVSNIIFEANGKQTSSSTTATNFTFDNFKIAGEKQSNTYGNVSVKYQDADGNSLSAIKTDVLHENLPTGSTYTATDDEKANFNDGSFYYVYDATITTDNVTVKENTTTELILKFRKFPILTNSTLTWTGAINGTWNELNQNFTSDGSNSLGYQNTNGVIFPQTATNKTVSLKSTVDLGTQDLTISGSGYNLTTGVLGNITGTGALNINLSGNDGLSIGITNNLSGATQIAGGTITVNKAGSLGVTPNITGTSTIIAGVAQTFPAMTFGASSTIQGGTYVNKISGMSAPSGVKIAISSSHNTNNDYAFDFDAVGSLASGSELELTGTATETKFGMTTASNTYLANTKVSLKGTAFLFLDVNQSGASTINIGTLSGETGTKLGWGKSSALDRHITWSVGANNENSEFAGTITNLGGYAGSGSFYTGNYTHLTKVGTGKLTLSGISNAYNGNLTINSGEVLVSGTLRGNNQATTPLPNTVTIAPNAKLTVTGSLTATNLVINSDANGTGTLVNTGTITLTNPATVNQYLSSARNWYISAPIAGATVPAGSTYYYYDETQKMVDADGDHWIPVTEGTALVVGKGYIAQPGAATTLTFNGLLNDGDKSIVLTRQGATSKGFNLVGNPYPSYLDAAALLSANRPEGAEKVENNIWYRTRTGSLYQFQTYNATGDESVPQAANASYIHPMQSFWVRALADNVELNFTNAMRKHNETLSPILLRVKATSERQRLRLQANNGTTTDEALIYFDANASNAFDRYDAPKFAEKNTVTQIFTTAGNEKLVINGMNSIPLDTPIGLGFVPGNATSFSIKANEVTNLPSDVRVILKDNTNGLETDLTDGITTYQFAPATTSGDRFSIIFRSPNLTTGLNNTDKTNVSVYVKSNKQIVISAPANSSYAIYNVLGQIVEFGKVTNSTLLTPCYNTGV